LYLPDRILYLLDIEIIFRVQILYLPCVAGDSVLLVIVENFGDQEKLGRNHEFWAWSKNRVGPNFCPFLSLCLLHGFLLEGLVLRRHGILTLRLNLIHMLPRCNRCR